MPRATVNTEETEHKDLKTALPDGYVVLKRMTYGQIVQRRSMLKMSFTSEKGNKNSFAGEVAMANEAITQFEFKVCIIDHNLEDENGNKLKLGSLIDFQRLDPKIGQEIEQYISDLNNFDEEDEAGN